MCSVRFTISTAHRKEWSTICRLPNTSATYVKSNISLPSSRHRQPELCAGRLGLACAREDRRDLGPVFCCYGSQARHTVSPPAAHPN